MYAANMLHYAANHFFPPKAHPFHVDLAHQTAPVPKFVVLYSFLCPFLVPKILDYTPRSVGIP